MVKLKTLFNQPPVDNLIETSNYIYK